MTTLCNVVSTLFQRRALTLYQRCATLKIGRRILFHFQRRISVISTLITTLKQRWSDVEILARIGMCVQNWQKVVFFFDPLTSKPSFDSPLHWKRAFGWGWCLTTCQHDSHDGPNILYHWTFFFIHVLERLANLAKIYWCRLLEDCWYEAKLTSNWLRSKFPRKSDSKTFNSFDESALLMAFQSNSSTFLNFSALKVSAN